MAQFIELRHSRGALAERNGADGFSTTEWPASRIESPRGQACLAKKYASRSQMRQNQHYTPANATKQLFPSTE